MKKIVVIGGGFAGLTAISKLKKYINQGLISVTLIDVNNYSLFTPMLPEVVSGTVKPENIVFSLREITAKNKAKFISDRVNFIDQENQIVICNKNKIKYDYLILAAGSETNFRGNNSAKSNSREFKSIKDAIDLKYRVITLLEEASSCSDEDLIKSILSFSVIGGGITGVELACELQEFIEQRLIKEYINLPKESFEITVFEYADHILPGIDEDQAIKAQDVLLKKGVNVITNASVEEVGVDFIKYKRNGEENVKKSSTIIWVAGVKGQSFLTNLGFETTSDNRVLINHFLMPEKTKNIFIIGDASAYKFNDKILPPVAPLATQQATFACKNIINLIKNKPLKEFSYLHFGYLVSLGKNNSVVNLFGLKFRGKFAYWAWKFIYLFKIGMIKKQVAVFFDWILSAFFGHDAVLILNNEKCVGCNTCIENCPVGILKKVDGKVIKTDYNACLKCETCVASCKYGVHHIIK